MSKGLVISDLHLFCRRSEGDRLFAELEATLDQAEVLVLNGDIFDFRWSHLPNESATITAALKWVDDLLERKNWKAVHYVFGNHDCLTRFQAELKSLAHERSTLHCHDYLLRLGCHAFLHGDCTNRRMDAADLRKYREGWSEDEPRGPLHKAIYDSADAIGLSQLFHHCYFPQQQSAERVAHHLDHVMPNWRDQIDHCYFGHTHRPFKSHVFEGVRFHNTGSGIRGMGFQPLTFHPDQG